MRTWTAVGVLVLWPAVLAAFPIREELLVVAPPVLTPPSTRLGSVTTSFSFTDARGDGAVGRKGSSTKWVVDDLGPSWSTAVRRALQDAGAVVVPAGGDAPWSLQVELARIEMVADMTCGFVDVATSFTLMHGKEQVWRKNFNKKEKISGFSDLGTSIAKVLAHVFEEGLERAGQQYVVAPSTAAEPARPAVASQPQLAVLDFRGPLAADTLKLFSDEARGGALEGAGGRCTIMTRESVMAKLKDKGRCKGDDDSCDLENGKSSGADLILTGNVAKLGKRLRASLKVMDLRSGALVASKSFSADNEDGLADLVKANAAAALRDLQPH